MSSEGLIAGDAIAEESSHRDVDRFSDDNARPRLIPKKTYFDLHRHRRRNDDQASESEMNLHPRIQWSPGTTNIGSGYQIGTYDDSVTRDIMKPVLQREPSRPHPASFFTASKGHLPPALDSWGFIDAQPTQPDEIQHLLEPSPVIRRTKVSEEIAKPKKKFRDKFVKRSSAAILDMTISGSPRVLEDANETVRPEEEFRLLNERYIREGIIPVESSTKRDIATSGSTSSQAPFGSRKGKKPNLKSSTHAHSSCEHEIETPRTSFNYERPIGYQDKIEKYQMTMPRDSLNEKHVTIDTEAIEYLSPEGSTTSPLPARRSCEPLDVKNLRKLRDTESEPGPSGISQRDWEFSDSSSEIIDTVIGTKTPKISIYDAQNDDAISRSESEDSFEEMMNDESCNIDTFKIDNPFSDFSLKNINRDMGLLRQHTTESAIKAASRNHDLDQPGTSKGDYAMEIYRRKVSRSDSVEQPEKKSREQSYLESALTRMKKVSFLDKAVMTKNSQRMLDVIAINLIPKNGTKDRNEQTRIDWTFGNGFLRAIIKQLVGRSSDFGNIVLQDIPNNFDGEQMVFHRYDHNLQLLLAPLMENMINPVIGNFLKNYPSISAFRFSERSSDIMPVTIENCMGSDIVSFFETAWPKAIDDVVNVSPIRLKNMPNVYSEGNKTAVSREVSKLLECCDDRKTALLSLVRDYRVQFESVQSNELLDKIAKQVINIVHSQNLIREFLFLSFSPIPAPISNGHCFEGSYLSGMESCRPLTFGFFSTPIVIVFENFWNLYGACNSQKSEALERLCLALIDNTMRKLHFTYI